jgi:hypothetical protein
VEAPEKVSQAAQVVTILEGIALHVLRKYFEGFFNDAICENPFIKLKYLLLRNVKFGRVLFKKELSH